MREDLLEKHPLMEKICKAQEVFWINRNVNNNLSDEVIIADVDAAAERLERFAPYLQAAFTETEKTNGIIESPLKEIAQMKHFLEAQRGQKLNGKLMLKCDNLLPISGSIKARGGIYEVLWLAEKIALDRKMLKQMDDYSILTTEKFRKLFSEYSVAVGSTGNLGLSIGIMSARLGFNVTVHMSADAKQWKKDLLRKKGAKVIEYAGDYQKAVAKGRKSAENDPLCHFVDDENSKTLFKGYAVAGRRLQAQLDEQGIAVDKNHPLFVYLPCGVGGAPGGVAYGLKQIFGEYVHCFFAEPVQACCMLLGVMTGLHDEICVQDVGLSGKTSADGLAVGRASQFVGQVVGNLLDGIYSVEDGVMEKEVKELFKQENIFIEPSAAAGFSGYYRVQQEAYMSQFDNQAKENATHIVWATGGNMVPQEERDAMLCI